MDNDMLRRVAEDRSQIVTYSIGVNIEHARLTPEERERVLRMVSRHAKGIVTQLEMAFPDRCFIYLDRNSSKDGTEEVPMEDTGG